KSTLLRALALGIARKAEANGLLVKPLGSVLAQEASAGKIRLDFGGDYVHSWGLRRRINEEFVIDDTGPKPAHRQTGPEPALFVCGYGAGRFGTRSDESTPGYRVSSAVATLFSYDQALAGPELTLYRLQSRPEIYDRTLRGLKRALGLTEEDEIA